MKSKISMTSWKIQVALKSIFMAFDKGTKKKFSISQKKYGLKRKLAKIGSMGGIRVFLSRQSFRRAE